jgi:hypothetical protein
MNHRIALSMMIALLASHSSLAVDLQINGRPEHPTVYYNRDDLARARHNRQTYDWAKKFAAELLKTADTWAAKDDATLRSYIPEPGACFA